MSPTTSLTLSSKRKWLWLGVLMGFFHPIAGLVYGGALFFEQEARKEGIIVIVWTIAWAIASFFLFGYLAQEGFLPRFQVIPSA